MNRYLIFLFAFFASMYSSAQNKPSDLEKFVSKLDQKVPQMLQDFSVPGAAVAIIDNGIIVLQRGYGFADIENETRITSKTGFNIASISKTVTAWGVMKLVQEGKIDLDAPAEKYLTRWHIPDSKFDSDEVTIRRLLSHTAGLSLSGYPNWTFRDTLPTLVESLNGNTNGVGRVEIIMKPGLKYKYSGGGYTILQLIIEEVTRQKFQDYMQEAILTPLGMTNSSFRIDEKIIRASATEYDNFGEAIDFEIFTAQAAAGLHTTIEDFSRFVIAGLQRGRIQNNDVPVLLPANVIKQMMDPAPSTEGIYGLGYEILTGNLLKGLRGHTGSNAGWQSMFMIDPDTQNGFIVFTNGGAGYNIINAIYCEWIALVNGEEMWEGCTIQPSIANKLKEIIDEEGIDNIAETYNEIKREQPYKYNYAENQLNNLGYFYYSRNELNIAESIFRLNVEIFPDAYNTYDSYGEVLLAQGDQNKAIKNYKKSVELNPGNGHGINVLNELGISVDELIEQFSFSIDSRVLAGYEGRYQTSTGEILSIQAHKGKLTAVIQELQLNLMAQSETRFVAFGDGEIYTFFTAATGQKGLWARERVWRKLPDTINNRSVQLTTGNFLIFRDKSSWDRITDFENVLSELGCSYVVRESNAMADLDFSPYDVIIIPGFQSRDYYNNYINSEERFNAFTAKGGVLLLELNPGISTSFSLPGDVTMTRSLALENEIIASDHPIFFPLFGKRRVWARHASSGYFQNIPEKANILAVETDGVNELADRPTFIEYLHGSGSVIAAFQCFHDRDGSGRGPLMESTISYALKKSWKKLD